MPYLYTTFWGYNMKVDESKIDFSIENGYFEGECRVIDFFISYPISPTSIVSISEVFNEEDNFNEFYKKITEMKRILINRIECIEMVETEGEMK